MTARAELADSGETRQLSHVARTLSKAHGNPRHHNKDDPLDELVFILLSAKTAERSYLRTYDALSARFPDWWSVSSTKSGTVARIIRAGGLARKKEAQLRGLLALLSERLGGRDLSLLRRMSTPDAENLLTTLPGVGLKTARCVLMYSLGRQVFPVDTHCRRVLSRLGFIEYRRLTDRVQDEIQALVPEGIRYDLHVNLVAHGRETCTPRDPKCGRCLIARYCSYYVKLSRLTLRPSARPGQRDLSSARPPVAVP